jgi:hypothetical protein
VALRVGVVVASTAVIAGWLGIRAEQVRSHLLAARSSLALLQNSESAADPAAVRRASATAGREVGAARAATRDPVWRVAGAVPVLGRTFTAAADLTEVADALVRGALPPLVAASEAASARPPVQHGRVDLAQLEQIDLYVSRAATSLHRLSGQAAAVPRRGLPGVVLRRRDEFVAQVQDLDRGISSAAAALDVAPGMLGAAGPRRYLVVVQNNAESRATGGLIGAYAVVRADHGRLTRERVGTNDDLHSAAHPVVDLGPDFAARYDQYASRRDWRAAGMTPDWPSAAAILTGLAKAQGGGVMDGVIGVDAPGMAEILKATGPATIGDRSLGPGDVADFVLRDEYTVYADNAHRKAALAQLAAALFDSVTSGRASSSALATSFARAASSGHLQVASSHPTEEALLRRHRVGGALPSGPGGFVEVVTQNASGNKLDFYLRRSVEYQPTAPGTARLSVTINNTVTRPESLPPVVVGRLDPDPQHALGETKLILTLYAGVGRRFHRILVAGQAVPAEFGTEGGHGYVSVSVLVRPGSPLRVDADVDDPGGPVIYRQQPLVVDDRLVAGFSAED